MEIINLLKLEPNSSVALISCARKVSHEEVKFSMDLLKSWDLKLHYGKNLFAQDHQFAGSISQRVEDLQWALDDSSIKAIFFVRGGYGSVQIIDHINWSKFKKKSKWLIGFSDVTVFHSHIHQNIQTPTLHAPMPVTFSKNSPNCLSMLKQILFGEKVSYKLPPHLLNKLGQAEGEIVGGNLSVLYSLLGSQSQLNTKGKILFIEDLDEYLYHIDRMMQALLRSGMLADLSGLIVGSMSDMNDNKVPFGKTAHEIIYDAVSAYSFPVVFGFPAGHIQDNNPLILGQNIQLCVEESQVKIY